jgi:methionyl-tRNA synthetase
MDLYAQNPGFILPETRRNEVLAFVRQGLADLSISRTTIKWGIPLPVPGNHVFYVWFDALTTYKSAVEGEDLWPADLHLIGKEIVRFHAIFWPAFLMAAGYPLPKRIFAHGFWMFENDKMSKSRGNIVRANPIVEVMGIDALRYFLLREVTFGKDGSFSYDALIGRYNADLANGLGNLVSRTLTMINQYRGGFVPAPVDVRLGETIQNVHHSYDDFDFSRALEEIWGAISWLDGFIVQQQPWKLAKSQEEGAQDRLDAVLYTAAEYLRVITALAWPVIPDTARKIWAMLGMTSPLEDVRIVDLMLDPLPAGQKVETPTALFPRIEAKVAVDRMRELEAEETRRQAALLGKELVADVEVDAATVQVAPLEPEITIDDFVKVDLRVGLVKSAEPVKGADKLLHLKVDIGEAEPRTIVAGIAKAYQPEQLIGRKVVIVANLAPRKLRGIESRGMIVAASLPDGPPVLAGFLESIEPGARLK